MHEANQQTFRWMIMIDDFRLESWAIDCVKSLLQESQQELVGIVVKKNESKGNASFLNKLSRYPYKNLLFRVYQRFRVKRNFVSQHVVNYLGLQHVTILECLVHQKGSSEYLDINDVEKIVRQKPDFILRFGFGILKGEILQSATYGIWSFHHDDEQIIRGGPAGFWEIMNKQKANGVLLQQLTEKLDAGRLIEKAFLPVIAHSYQAHYEMIMHESKILLLKAFRKLKFSARHFSSLPVISSQAEIYKFPNNLQCIQFWIILFFNKLNFHWDELFRTEFWQVGFTNEIIFTQTDLDVSLEKKKVTWFQQKNEKYLADPFLYKHENALQIIAEEYDYKLRKAKLVSWKAADFSSKKVALQSTNHVSYPSIILNKGTTFCMPESYQSNSVSIYKFDDFQNEFHLSQTLIRNIKAVDSTLYFDGTLFWMFYTLEGDVNNTYLYLRYSPSLDSEFIEHPLNPIVCDITSSRPAGNLLMHEGKLFRPTQDCSVTYGWKIHFMEVKLLNTNSYHEVYSHSLDVSQSNDLSGIHTINYQDEKTVFDVKYYKFSGANFKYNILRKLRLK